MKQEELPAFMTARDLKEYMGIGLRTAYEMMHGPLSNCVVRVGRRGTGLRLVRDSFLDWIRREEATPVDPPIPGRGLAGRTAERHGRLTMVKGA